MKYSQKDCNPYLISLCVDQSLEVERSKRFYTHEVKNLAHLKELITLNRFWSPILWEEGHNKKDKFKKAYFLVLDIDDGEISLDLARRRLKINDFGALIYTTSSHQKEKSGNPPCDRFRLIIPFSRPIKDIKIYEHNLKIWIKKYSADRACGSGATCFKPALGNVEIFYGENVVDPLPLPPPIERPKSRYLGAREIPSWLQAKLTFAPRGQRHLELFSVSATLSSFGFSEAETINIVSQSPLWEQGTDDDSRRTARDGWTKGQQD